ncbi:MerR family transcriptional regulator [Sporolactobacillus shoreicorticis]|uniref:MerR family transcriptional regulator n=1 Tax=Sporolactobacillus shoreicorticis TaxID=1923877 RepID=A0ABW5S0F3_9BACL|nr:MerR family transcriptional regulator [Sporolactobacillus shoreicorticis]MCO7124625.1 MerR family transcriptional regulator [Sporolactobacillus shoreicorticis]
MTIDEASKKTGLPKSTIRYYEKLNIVPPIKRNKNEVRVFDNTDIEWLLFVKQMRGANVSIKALVRYISLFKEGGSSIKSRIKLLTDELHKLQAHIFGLQAAEHSLSKKIEEYRTHVIPTEQKLV